LNSFNASAFFDSSSSRVPAAFTDPAIKKAHKAPMMISFNLLAPIKKPHDAAQDVL